MLSGHILYFSLISEVKSSNWTNNVVNVKDINIKDIKVCL